MLTWPDTNSLPPTWRTLTHPAIKRATSTSARNYERAAAAGSGSDRGNLSLASFEPIAQRVRGLMERPDGNNVSIDRESLLLAEAQMKFNLGIQLLKDQFHTISLAINSGGTSS